jgi:hypothetical protein
MPQARYIAMWSGPRNISTAMMRSWGSRADTVVHDEPFYAHYLTRTEHDHPGAEEVIAAYSTDWQTIVQQITAPLPSGKTIYYQKHMTHHMLEHISLSWMLQMDNCFLIREPRQVIASFSKVIAEPKLDQIGFPRQLELFRYVRQQTGKIPPVIDAADVLRDPRGTLSRLCAVLELPFDEAMLKWEAGKRATDGVWAKYWYAAVEQSTGFMPYAPDDSILPAHMHELSQASQVLYDEMAAYKI